MAQCSQKVYGEISPILTFLCVIALQRVTSAVISVNSTSPSVGPELVTDPTSNNNTGCGALPAYNVTASGTDLYCYQCNELYTKRYDPNDSPCLNNLSLITVRRCSPGDIYCKVERLMLSDIVISIDRGCASKCPFGCRYNGYGLQYERCYSCCNTYGCNSGNEGHSTHSNSNSITFVTLIMSVMLTHGT